MVDVPMMYVMAFIHTLCMCAVILPRFVMCVCPGPSRASKDHLGGPLLLVFLLSNDQPPPRGGEWIAIFHALGRLLLHGILVN